MKSARSKTGGLFNLLKLIGNIYGFPGHDFRRRVCLVL